MSLAVIPMRSVPPWANAVPVSAATRKRTAIPVAVLRMRRAPWLRLRVGELSRGRCHGCALAQRDMAAREVVVLDLHEFGPVRMAVADRELAARRERAAWRGRGEVRRRTRDRDERATALTSPHGRGHEP